MFESINQNKNTKEEKPSKNTSINIPESPTIQGVESQVFKNRTDTIFYSENKNGYISELSENLKGNIQYEKLMMSHDAMHPIIQAKLESLGVKTTRVTSLENEIIILAFSLSDDTIKNDFGIDGSNLISTTKQIIKDQLSIHIKDYKINEEKYLEYEKTLQKIFIQSSILSQKSSITQQANFLLIA
ncbi:hypothetical protein HC766_02180 [Candidatus Gracilibacteria bacterium]|nr:hypothetical protein [Candidatus Gracilibacteria bacterium]